MPINTRKSDSIKRNKTSRVHGSRGLHDTIINTYNGINGFNTYKIGVESDKSIYGEVSLQGIRNLYDKFMLYAPLQKTASVRPKFYDLGSGVGKVVIGIAVLNTDIESYGIENVPDRARLASFAHSKIKSSSLQKRVNFIHDSFLSNSVSLKGVNWIFISNTCFDSETQNSLVDKIHREVDSGTIIICSRPLAIDSSKFAVLEKNCIIPMSWSNTTSCYIYKRVQSSTG
jgi:hypothetical protein